MEAEDKKYPFKFLDAYDKEDKDYYFGRKKDIDDLYEMIFQSRMLLVYGGSGTGKTSLIQCGLASRFSSHEWLSIFIRRGSGANGINTSLKKAIEDYGGYDETPDFEIFVNSKPKTEAATINKWEKPFKAIYLKKFRPIYLIFDQFEELFVIGSKAEQDEFIETVQDILRLEQSVKMIFSIREDYLGRLFEFEKEVPQLMSKKLRVEPMTNKSVVELVIGISELKNSFVTIRAGEEQIIADELFEIIKGKDGLLQPPLLQVFLDRLYYKITKDEGHKTDAELSYELIHSQMGKMDNILRDFLDEQVINVSDKLSNDNAKITTEEIWSILSSFITLDGTKEPITKAALQEKLHNEENKTQPDIVNLIVDEFEKCRLLRQTEGIYELAHDALAGKISEKRSDEQVARLEAKSLIKNTAAARKKAPGVVLNEEQLRLIEPYAGKIKLDTNEEELIEASKIKLQESVDEIKRQKEKEAEEIEREWKRVEGEKERKRKEDEAKKIRKRRRKRYRFISVLTAVVMLIMAGLTIWAMQKTKECQLLLCISQSYLSTQVRNDVTKGFRYAQYALKKEPENMDAKAAFYVTLNQDTDKPELLFYQYTLKHEAPVKSVAFSPDGKRLLTVSGDFVTIWDAATGKKLLTLKAHAGSVNSAVFSPKKNWVLTAGDTTAKIWDVTKGKVIATLKGHHDSVFSAVFSHDGRRVLTASADNTAGIWEVTGKELWQLKHTNMVRAAVFSSDDTHILTISDDDGAKIWDVARKKALTTLDGRTGPVNSAVFSPDGRLMLTTSGSTAKIWDVTKGKVIATLKGHTDIVNSAIFSSDGKQVLTASADNTAILWDTTATSWEEKAILGGHSNSVNSAVFSWDGKTVLTASNDGTAKLWDAANPFHLPIGQRLSDFNDNNIRDYIDDMNTKVDDLSQEEKNKYGIK